MFLQPVKSLSFITAALLIMAAASADSIPVTNHSFEVPEIDPNENPFMAISFAPGWTEDDIDPENLSRNTGIFRNTPADSNDHLINPDGDQLAFLGGYQGNALWQYLPETYQEGKSYKLTVGICVSMRIPPPQGSSLVLAFHYLYGSTYPVDIASVQVPAPPSTSRTLEDFSVTLPVVKAGDPWLGKNIGIAIRGTGMAGGFWDVDNVRLVEFPRFPELTNDSFVNLDDFAVIASEWLSCTQTTADLTGEGCVNLKDLILLSEKWLNNV